MVSIRFTRCRLSNSHLCWKFERIWGGFDRTMWWFSMVFLRFPSQPLARKRLADENSIIFLLFFHNCFNLNINSKPVRLGVWLHRQLVDRHCSHRLVQLRWTKCTRLHSQWIFSTEKTYWKSHTKSNITSEALQLIQTKIEFSSAHVKSSSDNVTSTNRYDYSFETVNSVNTIRRVWSPLCLYCWIRVLLF